MSEAGDRKQLIERIGPMMTARLMSVSSSLSLSLHIDSDVENQVQAVLSEAIDALEERADGQGPVPGLLSYDAHPDFLEVGLRQARSAAHPAEALVVADILFDTAAAPFAEWGGWRAGLSTTDVLRVLHHAIWRRFPAGAVGYTEMLRQRLFEMNDDARLKVSRDLHDRVAHGIAAGLQRMELATRDANGEAHLEAATSILRAALSDVQNIASELRVRVGERSIADALSEYVGALADTVPPVRFSCFGTAMKVLPATSEEAYMITIEAIRNARKHAPMATAIDVSVKWIEGRRMIIAVSDDGPGFQLDAIREASHLGLRGMNERAALFGATLSVISAPGAGTTIELDVPHLNGHL